MKKMHTVRSIVFNKISMMINRPISTAFVLELDEDCRPTSHVIAEVMSTYCSCYIHRWPYEIFSEMGWGGEGVETMKR